MISAQSDLTLGYITSCNHFCALRNSKKDVQLVWTYTYTATWCQQEETSASAKEKTTESYF